LNGFDHVGYINVSNNNLTVLPNTFLIHFPKLRIIDVSNNRIEALHSNTFEGISPNILLLDNNELEALSPLIFSASLRRLSISNNKISSIPSYTLHNLPDLQYINLAHNRLNSLPRDFLQTSSKIEDLIVSDNRLTRIDPRIFDGKQIGNVDFSRNWITLLTSHQFDIIQNIGQLDVSYNEITGLPNHLFNTDIELELDSLDLTGNSLYNIAPHFMPRARMLSFLRLGENYLSNIDRRSLQKYGKLIELDLHSNSFVKVSHSMFPFSASMITLNLADNPLTDIDNRTFAKFPPLAFLDLSHTDLTHLDVEDLNGVPELETLSLEYSKLEKLHIDQFLHVTNLNVLRLSHCELRSISEINFGSQLNSLTELYLNHNPFHWIGDKSFSKLPRIQHVDLSHCNLTELHISDHAFTDSKILTLQLSYNNLTDINQKWMNSLTELKELNLTHNPIKGIKSDTFENSNIKSIDLRWTNIPCLPQWLSALGIVVLLDERASMNCRNCFEPGWWSNGTELCAQCSEFEVCANDEWDETGTFRLKSSVAGKPPDGNTISFVDNDYHPNLVSGTLKWGDIPDESVANTQEWAFYLSMDGKTSDSTAIVVVAVNDGNEYQIPPATDVGFNRYLLMYGRNGGGDGKEFSSFQFVDKCTLCVCNASFSNESQRKYHIKGELVFDGPLEQEGIDRYQVYVGHNPYSNENLELAAIKTVKVSNVRQYRVFIDELNTNGMPYLWIRSFFEDGEGNKTPTNDVQAIKIVYTNKETGDELSADRQIRFP